MTYTDILVQVDDHPRARVRLELAAGLAARFQAHLIALNVRDQTLLPSHVTAQFGGDLDQFRAAGDAEAALAGARALLLRSLFETRFARAQLELALGLPVEGVQS